MKLTRNLRTGMSGEDVRAVKDKLFALGYYNPAVKKITHDSFGENTEDAVRAYQRAMNLEDDGIVGEQTWGKLFPENPLPRVMKYLMTGEDVRYVKDKLFALGFYSDKITKITNNRFGADTVDAVKAFQKKYHLNEDGIVGENTWKKLHEVSEQEETKEEPTEETAGITSETAGTTAEPVSARAYPRIGEQARAAINEALKEVSEDRRKMVLKALEFVTDATIAPQFEYPSSLYIRGGNLYNKDLSLNTITEKYLSGSYYKKYKSYCTSGRLEMMIAAVKLFLGVEIRITGADCSGGIVGLLRYFGLVSCDFDDTANGLCGGHSTAIKKAELRAADFVGRSGHICLYAGGGWLIEWVGGEYGCQLTNMNDHRAWSFTKKKYVKQKACTKYRRPKFYR